MSGRRVILGVAIALVAVAALGGAGTAAPAPGAGSLLSFGYNEYGGLGYDTNAGTPMPNPTPAPAALPDGAGPVVRAAAGSGHSLAVTSSGQLYAFGYNYFGELASTTNNTTNFPNSTPTLVALPGEIGTVTKVAAGMHFSLVVTSSGQLYAFGTNTNGELGNATDVGMEVPNPTPALVTLPGEVGPVTQVAAGGFHSLVVTSSGQLYAFGYNFYGELGSATHNGASTPNPTPTLVGLPGEIGAVTQVAAGTFHSLVVTSSGQLYAFGTNFDGQLGSAANNSVVVANPTPALVTLPGEVGPVTQVAAGGNHSLALTSTGQVYAFGLNQSGQLGGATNAMSLTPNPTPILVDLPGEVGTVTQIGSGGYHSLVVTSSGQLYVFGGNYYGQLGSTTNNTTSNANATATLVAFAPGTTIDAVAVGGQGAFTLALVSDLAITSDALADAQVGANYHADLLASGGTAPLTWTATGLPAGVAIDATSGAVSGTPGVPGTFGAEIAVTDVYGSTTSHKFTLTVTAATPVGATAGAEAKSPSLSALKQSAGRWLLGSKSPRLVPAGTRVVRKHGLPVGTTFNFRVDQAAHVTFTFRHTAVGRRPLGGRCVAKTQANAGKPHCTRTLTNGTLQVQARAGVNRLYFEGRITTKIKLTAGSYSVAVAATTAAGKTSAPQTLQFSAVSPLLI